MRLFELSLLGFVPSIFGGLLLNSWGDDVGRKPPIAIGFIGLLALVLIFISTIQFNLPLEVLLVGRAVSGVCGDFYGLAANGYAYVADISTPTERTVKLAAVSACMGFGGFVANMISGPWFEAQVISGNMLTSFYY